MQRLLLAIPFAGAAFFAVIALRTGELIYLALAVIQLLFGIGGIVYGPGRRD